MAEDPEAAAEEALADAVALDVLRARGSGRAPAPPSTCTAAHAATLRSADVRVEASSAQSEAGPDADGCVLRVTPESAGWRYVGFEVYRDGARHAARRRPRDVRGRAVGAREPGRRAAASGATSATAGSVFDGPPAALYVPPGIEWSAEGGRLRRVHGARRDRRRAAPARARPMRARGARHGRRGARHRPHPDGGRARRVAARDRGRARRRRTGRATRRTSTTSTIRRARRCSRRPTTTASGRPGGFAFQRVYTDDRTIDEAIAVGRRRRRARSPRLPPVLRRRAARALLPERDGRPGPRVARDHRPRVQLDLTGGMRDGPVTVPGTSRAHRDTTGRPRFSWLRAGSASVGAKPAHIRRAFVTVP